MRAMILAAGLGTRLRPLTAHRAKPALPVRGRAVVSLLLEFLSKHGIQEVMINLHYLSQTIRDAVEMDCPPSVKVIWSDETEPLGTGGGIRRAASFLSADDDCIVLAGDMLVDFDLELLVDQHRRSGDDATLVLRDDPRCADFGTIGIDAGGKVARVAKRITGAIGTGPEFASGLFTGVRIFSKSVFRRWPEQGVFEDLRDWLIPGLEGGHFRIGGVFVDAEETVWEPVGTPCEYLKMNLSPPSMPSLGGDPSHWGGDVEVVGSDADVVLGAQTEIGPNVRLERVVVWSGESVPEGFSGRDGVFAGGQFYDCASERILENETECSPTEVANAGAAELEH